MNDLTSRMRSAAADGAAADDLLEVFLSWVTEGGISPYPAQEEALLELYAGSNVILSTPTGSGKSLVALGMHAEALATGRRSFYTAPIKALVSEKFFALCRQLGSDHVGMLTGDAAVNASAPVVCCTAEILANLALRADQTLVGASVCMDEFHYYADPDRGWAWQVPVLTMPSAQFLLMSATLGDVRPFVEDLTDRTKRPTAAVGGGDRPIPLEFSYCRTPVHETIEALLASDRAPVYVVHPTQAGAVDRAQALMSVNVCSRSEKAALADSLGGFRFAPGFGPQLGRYLRHGVGVHHAGMLPKYRLLVEQLAQDGLLKVICGTDTLGVGINVPIRSVLMTQLCKFDGTRTRIMTAREFHQIAGRAGRAGFDTAGWVVVQAPEHVIDNERAEAKAASASAGPGGAKKRKVVKAKPPERGFVNWTEETFARLVKAPPETLTSSFGVSHSMLLNVLDRTDDLGPAILKRLLVDNHETPRARRRHIRRAIAIYRSLIASGVLSRVDDESGTHVRVDLDLQRDFRLNQPLSPFVLEAVGAFPADSPTYALDVLSMVEASLEDPAVVLRVQLRKLKDEVIGQLKAEGVDYDDRMAVLETMEHPKPRRDETYELFNAYRARNPWVADHDVKPKAVARDMFERAMTFGEYVHHLGLARSEGLLLRYLSDAYKGLVQTVPEAAKTESVFDLTEWLHEIVRQTDSSLIDEWERLRAVSEDAPVPEALVDELADDSLPPVPPALTSNERAFRILVRNECFRQVELLARRSTEQLAELAVDGGLSLADLVERIEAYWSVHDRIETGAQARSSAFFGALATPHVGSAPKNSWTVRQTLDDPAGDHDWQAVFLVDLDRSDATGEPVVVLVDIVQI